MDKLDDVIYIAKQFKRQAETAVMRDLYFTENPSNIIGFCDAVLELLKEKQGTSVDAFLQWCIESNRMGDASRKGIEYWINEFKAWKQKAKDGDQ